MNIDRIFIINLEHRTDRKTKITSELKRLEINNYEFFKAIKPTEEAIIKWNPNFLNPMPVWFNGDASKYKIGSLGCMLSHLEIIKQCIAKKYKNVLILEDDTIFCINTGFTFDNVLSSLKPQITNLNFGLLYFAGNHINTQPQQISNNIIKVNGSYTTGSYIINESVMEYIVQNIQGYNREVDVYYANVIQKLYPCYCTIPHLTKQDAGYSDIVHANVSYNL